jgi:16S rRNA (uracil1498-N3)-methyltransferase
VPPALCARVAVHRFFLPPSDRGVSTLTLSAGDSHHACRVLRLQVGDRLEVLDGAGRVYLGQVSERDPGGLRAEVLEVRDQPPPPLIGLGPALLKGRAMDFLLQKATELGAVRISPLLTTRTVVQVDPREVEDRRADWSRCAQEACKQCGNAWLPQIDAPQSLTAFLATPPQGLLLAAMLRADAELPGAVLERSEGFGQAVTLLTGPEGDFTREEQEAMLQVGIQPITLGPRVLRAETAVLAGLAILQHEWVRKRGVSL